MPIEIMFTIIIPTYNSENTLSNSIDSILKQTFTDFEILIMDGCFQLIKLLK
jgi:glycosyltransferase involved in cell wall biosynthesis